MMKNGFGILQCLLKIIPIDVGQEKGASGEFSLNLPQTTHG
jgi:hypothetical protein